MWNRRDLKSKARATMKRSYVKMVIVCLIMYVFVGAYGASTLGSTLNAPFESIATIAQEPMLSARAGRSNTDIVNDFAKNFFTSNREIFEEASLRMTATEGIFAGVFNNITRSGSFIFGTLNALNQFIFQDRVVAGVTLLVGASITFLYWFFIGNPMRVGECRFFLENRSYPETRPGRLLFIFKIRRTRPVAKVMFFRTFYNVLWFFTIAGGFIKYYAYRMVPYLLAENPDLTTREAILLSRKMMRGHKWHAFLLDMSFLGWSMLSLFTLGILDVFLCNPYRAAANAELYLALREEMTEAEPGTLAVFSDRVLTGRFGGLQTGEYPVRLFPIQEAPGRRWMSADYHRRYSLGSLILLFFTFSMVGWVWEVLVDLINTGTFVNRGTMFGPWVPLYGCGGVLVLVLCRRWVDRPVITAALVALVCGVLEYATSWVLECFFGVRWWDYSGYFLNLNGRVCLEGLVVFAVAGCLGIYLLGPALDDMYGKVPRGIRIALCVLLASLFVTDLFFSARHPNMAATLPPPPENEAAGPAVPGAGPRR